MTSGDHKLSTHCFQETSHLICQGKPNQSCHSLSKSSSALASSGQEGLKRRQEVHKSLNNVLPVSKFCENNLGPLHSPERSQDGDTRSCFEQTNCSHPVTEHTEEKLQHGGRCLDVETSVASTEPRATKSFHSSNVLEKVSSFGLSKMSAFKAQSVDRLEIRAPVVQKSYSDFLYRGRTPSSGPFFVHSRNSATYSVLCSSSSVSGSCSDGASSITNDSGTATSPTTNQNNLTDVARATRDQNTPQCHLDKSTIQHNITVYTVPGTYQHRLLGPKTSGNGFPNYGRMYDRPHYNISGVMSCNDISDIQHSPPAMIVRNSCTLHCCRDYGLPAKVDDTIAAYCHALPIPSVQFSPGLACSLNEPVSGQSPPHFLSLPPAFTFPKLVSSVSESGLDAKKLMRCGRLAFPTPPSSIEELNLHSSMMDTPRQLIKNSETSSDNLQAADTKTKDTWTMTSMNYIPKGQKLPPNCRDAEVQTVIIMENKSVATSPCFQTSGRLFADAGVGLHLQCPKSPVRDVRWDKEGMTWEVYGAAVDPEILGMAIQKHLEIQIEEHSQNSEVLAENPARQSTKGKRRSFRTVMNSLRHSNCCVCSTAE